MASSAWKISVYRPDSKYSSISNLQTGADIFRASPPPQKLQCLTHTQIMRGLKHQLNPLEHSSGIKVILTYSTHMKNGNTETGDRKSVACLERERGVTAGGLKKSYFSGIRDLLSSQLPVEMLHYSNGTNHSNRSSDLAPYWRLHIHYPY